MLFRSLFTLVILLLLMVCFLYWEARHPIAKLNKLIERMENEVSHSQSMGVKNAGGGALIGKKTKSYPCHSIELEHKIIDILNKLRRKNYDIVFVFDELDKLSEKGLENSEDSQEIVDGLLRSIKNFITGTKARFFFISGRETIDSYYSERGSANSLYESLFDQVIEIPSLLTDNDGEYEGPSPIASQTERYVCARLGLKEKAPYSSLNKFHVALLNSAKDEKGKKNTHLTIQVLRHFIYYLTFHSWGNPKRLAAIFESFLVPEEGRDSEHEILMNAPAIRKHTGYSLQFNFDQQRSLALTASIFTLFQHQLSREVAVIGDKPTVTALSSLQFILKLHQFAFTRESLHRMSEAINLYRTPELNVIVDDLLTQVFKPYIRRVRNGAYRYRFHSCFEQEIRYITHVSDLESASYNFSLDAMGPVKKHFQSDIDNRRVCDDVRARAYITLGDMNAIEQAYNSSAQCYLSGISLLTAMINKQTDENTVVKDHIDLNMTYIDTLLKYGDLEEHRQNYNKAAAAYAQANSYIDSLLKDNEGDKEETAIYSGDSKWDVYKQAYWADLFLSLKRSLPDNLNDLEISLSQSDLFDDEDPRVKYRLATFAFYLGTTSLGVASKNYLDTIKFAKGKWDGQHAEIPNERRDYLIASALSGLAEARLTHDAYQLRIDINKAHDDEISKRSWFENQLSSKLTNDYQPEPSTGYVSLFSLSFTHQNLFINLSKESGVECLGINNPFTHLQIAAVIFEKSNLYVSAVITHFKIITYLLSILEALPLSGGGEKSHIERTFTTINESAKKAYELINMARQIDSSQSTKTLVFRDYKTDDMNSIDGAGFSQLFDLLLGTKIDAPDKLDYSAFWQHSIWSQKLAALLYWKEFLWVQYTDTSSHLLPSSFLTLNFEPSKNPSLSIRSTILMRWIFSRALLRSALGVGKSAFKSSELLQLFPSTDGEINDSWQSAYLVARNLHFSILDIRLISRKNLELIHPSLPHFYYVQWNLLSNIVLAILEQRISEQRRAALKQLNITLGQRIEALKQQNFTYILPPEYLHERASLRSISLFIQKQFVAIDSDCGGREKIPPSHFDYETTYTKLCGNLKEAMNFHDNTSRTRTSTLQQKYYCHDDHNDADFRTDWTHAHMFSPASVYLYEEVQQIGRASCRERV